MIRSSLSLSRRYRSLVANTALTPFHPTCLLPCLLASLVAVAFSSQRWREEGFRLVERAGENATYLEDLTGLTELKRVAEEGWELDDDEDDF